MEKDGPPHSMKSTGVRRSETTHEPTGDVNLQAVVLFGIGLVLAGVAIFFTVHHLWNYLNEREARLENAPSPLVSSDAPRLPPEPRLQLAPGHPVHPLEEMKQLQASEERILHTYGWVDQEAGIARIPIDLAMQLLLEKGLSSNPQAQGDLAFPLNPRAAGTRKGRQ